MKKKIAYFTPDCFLDVDLPVLSKLSKSFDIDWFVLYTYEPKGYKYSNEEVRSFAKQHGITISIHTRKYRLRHILNLLVLMRMFVKIRGTNPDMIYFTAEDDIYFSLLASLFFPVAKTVKGVHNVIAHEKFDTFLKRFSHDLMRKRFKYFHFFSSLQAEYFRNKFRLADHYIARLSLFQNRHEEMAADRNKHQTRFIFFGRITYYKGVDILIKAVNKLSEEFDNFKVTIAGRCEDWQEYQSLIASPRNLDLNIRMVPNDQLKEYLSESHFAILPYRSVTQSGVITVYYNSYVPAIASDLDGFKEFVTPGVNGLTFKTEDVESLYQVMKTAIEMTKDQYNSMRKNLMLFTDKELDQDMIANKYLRFFNAMIERTSLN